MTVWHGHRGVYFTGRIEQREDGLYREVHYGGRNPEPVFVNQAELIGMQVICISGEQAEIRNYFKYFLRTEPLTVAHLRSEFLYHGRQFQFVYGDEYCIPDPAQRAYAVRALEASQEPPEAEGDEGEDFYQFGPP